MNNNIAQTALSNPNKFSEPYYEYALELVVDIVLGIVLGLGVNILANYIGRIFNLSKSGKLIVQLILISIVLYVLKVDSEYLHLSWQGNTSYGIVFVSIFFASQHNLYEFFMNIFVWQEKYFGK